MSTIKIPRDQIISEIKALGIKEGDILFLSANLLKVGYFSIDRQTTLYDWVKMLIEIVGENGTLVIPAYTNSFSIFNKRSDVIFSNDAVTTSGSLSYAFQMYPGVLRSKHPTNSCFAIGRYAKFILDGHDENSSSYLPYLKVVLLKGKNLLLGTVDDESLSPMGMHCAQESLGLTKKHWLAGILQTYYYDDSDNIKLFTRKDVGGCAAGGHKTLGYHIFQKAIVFGRVGRSLSACIDCEKSFKIFKETLSKNPFSIKCDNKKKCACCYGSPVYRHPIFWVRKLLNKLLDIVRINFIK
jgi:aminoglycoside 3-N-acetyltransferase